MAGENSTRQQRSEVIKRTTRPLLPPGPNALTDQNKEQRLTAALPVLGGGATHDDLPRTVAVSLLSEELKAMPTETPKEVCKLPSRSLADELSRQANRLDPTLKIFNFLTCWLCYKFSINIYFFYVHSSELMRPIFFIVVC